MPRRAVRISFPEDVPAMNDISPGVKLRDTPAEFVSYSLSRQFPLDAVTDFPVSDGPIFRLHVHDCLQVGFCRQGSGIYIIGDDITPFRKGDVYVVPAQQVHFLQARTGVPCIWSWIFLEPLHLIAHMLDATVALERSSFCHPGAMKISASAKADEIIAHVTGIIKEIRAKEFGFRAVAKAQVLILMTKLYRMQPFRSGKALHPAPGRLQKIVPALRYIGENYGDEVRNTVLARACAMSVRNFNRSFKAVLHLSPKQYILRIRLAKACADLQSTDSPVRTIAFDNGFQSISSFNRAFHQAMGCSPRLWRKTS
jgi:AraC-like DNA-binding protein